MIAGRLFALWAMLIFLITMVPAFLAILIIQLIKEPKRVALLRIINVIWMRIFFLLTFCRIKIIGRENFKKGENYIVISNHNSMMDILLLSPFIPGANKTIAKIEMSRIPLFGVIYKTGSVLVDRKNQDSRKESYTKMKEVLAMGMHMCIYPEGTRNKTSAPLKEFHNGAFRLAIDTKKPIIPAVLFNTKKALPPDKPFYLHPCKMEMHFLPAREIKENDTYEGLKEEMFNLMSNYYQKKIAEGI
jgi:1-acyl-sn-glycerol-3-phosphate acyltransferase